MKRIFFIIISIFICIPTFVNSNFLDDMLNSEYTNIERDNYEGIYSDFMEIYVYKSNEKPFYIRLYDFEMKFRENGNITYCNTEIGSIKIDDNYNIIY